MFIKHISISRDATGVTDFRYYTDEGDGETKEVRVSNILPEIEVSALALYTALEKDQAITESYELLDSKLKELNDVQELMARASAEVEQLLFENDLTPEQRNKLISKYAPWEQGKHYIAGYIVNRNDLLYKVLQNHVSQDDWKPESTPALYMPIAPPEVISEWVQPFGGSGTYEPGTKVIFEGKVYENILQGKLNIWSPTGYPEGWKLVP